MRFNFKLEDVKYAKILCKDANGNPVSIKAGIKRIDSREIIACSKYDDNIMLINTQDVVLSMVCNDGLYRTKTLLKKIENAEPYIVFILETPQGIEYEQNREYFRIPVQYDCFCKTEEDDCIQGYEGKTVDISANGVCVVFKKVFLFSGKLTLIIYIENKPVELKVKYIRSEILENEEFKVSFAFKQISESDRDLISKICIQKQLENKRKALY